MSVNLNHTSVRNHLRVDDPGGVEGAHAAHAHSEHGEGEGHLGLVIADHHRDEGEADGGADVGQGVGHLPHHRRGQDALLNHHVRNVGDDQTH